MVQDHVRFWCEEGNCTWLATLKVNRNAHVWYQPTIAQRRMESACSDYALFALSIAVLNLLHVVLCAGHCIMGAAVQMCRRHW